MEGAHQVNGLVRGCWREKHQDGQGKGVAVSVHSPACATSLLRRANPRVHFFGGLFGVLASVKRQEDQGPS